MLNLLELEKLMSLNEALLAKECAKKDHTNTKRLFELQFHRSVLKDCIIERLSEIVESQTKTTRKVA